MVTIKEIAEKCNVSVATVSYILNGKNKVSAETKAMVLKTMEELGYQPNYIAQSMRNQKAKIICIIVEDIGQFTIPGMIEGVTRLFEETEYRIVVLNLRLGEKWDKKWIEYEKIMKAFEPALKEIMSIKASGMIYLARHGRVLPSFSDKLKVPCVVAYASSQNAQIPSVVIDDEKGAYELTQYLISMGHKRIGVIAGSKESGLSDMHTMKRLEGYQKALFENGILYDPTIVRYGSWNRESGYREAKPLVESRVTAIFCMADRMAGGAYDYLEEMQMKVGKDISVVGFDNQDIAEYFRPGLTTVELPLQEIGYRAAQILLEKINGDVGTELKEPYEEKMSCHLVLRNSVKNILIK